MKRSSNRAALRFGDFELLSSPLRMSKAGVQVELRNQAKQLLRLLAARTGEVVTYDVMQRTLWPEQIVDLKSNIYVLIGEIRRALDDDAKDPAYIETVPGRGYRFVATVRNAVETASNETPGNVSP
ncbi:MAG: winged helix-turn-helix domain-containing protein [Pseudomonadota bacterium]